MRARPTQPSCQTQETPAIRQGYSRWFYALNFLFAPSTLRAEVGGLYLPHNPEKFRHALALVAPIVEFVAYLVRHSRPPLLHIHLCHARAIPREAPRGHPVGSPRHAAGRPSRHLLSITKRKNPRLRRGFGLVRYQYLRTPCSSRRRNRALRKPNTWHNPPRRPTRSSIPYPSPPAQCGRLKHREHR